MRGACGDLNARPPRVVLIGRIDGRPRFCFPRPGPSAAFELVQPPLVLAEFVIPLDHPCLLLLS